MTIKLGIIGTGFIAKIAKSYIEESGLYDIHSVLGTTIDKAKEFEKHSVAFDNLENFVQSDIDTVYIASPNSFHFEQAKYCLENKLNVIVEKPSVTEGDFDKLVKIAKENEVYIIEAFRHLFDPNFIKIKNELAKFDKVTGGSLTFRQYSSRYNAYKLGDVKPAFDPQFKGGALRDLGVYVISSMIALFGEPQNANYFYTKGFNGVDLEGTIEFSYSDFNVLAQVSKIQNSNQPCEFFDNSGNILSTDNISTLSYIKLNNDFIVDPDSNKSREDLSFEFKTFPEIFQNGKNDIWTLEELNRISTLTHQLLNSLI